MTMAHAAMPVLRRKCIIIRKSRIPLAFASPRSNARRAAILDTGIDPYGKKVV
jgi:hypothetical protein